MPARCESIVLIEPVVDHAAPARADEIASAGASITLSTAPSITASITSTTPVPFTTLVCRRCGVALRPHVRLGWLRPRADGRRRGGHDHIP